MSLVNLAHQPSPEALHSSPKLGLHLLRCPRRPDSSPAHPILGIPTANDEIEGVEPITRDNVASRRLWLGLKYWQNESVLGKISMISKPKRRITLNVEDLRLIVRGYEGNHVAGLRSPGESLYLSTDQGILEARECVEKKIGGLVLCRVA
ncbi:uncharacterized protein N7483_000492 [Penicillium malachiteum]|uniref:uncharacterized protein n=1 Tax=Penicillium malachiteum TaxID=1324776 RepID=UPI0025484244|nr:uncharacterized protein N7483_000492 [Penicillium malachiteum]KAJ5735367.1 hypothetical protein N7483_000492 [Penicillium malachiteum]